jgi:hypothetical protein
MVEVGPESTIRIDDSLIKRIEPAQRSPMPEGLLTDISDRSLADLVAFMLSK